MREKRQPGRRAKSQYHLRFDEPRAQKSRARLRYQVEHWCAVTGLSVGYLSHLMGLGNGVTLRAYLDGSKTPQEATYDRLMKWLRNHRAERFKRKPRRPKGWKPSSHWNQFDFAIKERKDVQRRRR